MYCLINLVNYSQDAIGIKARAKQKNYIELINTIKIVTAVPILYPKAMIFKQIHYKM